jgi:hypothetical protein
MISSKVWTGKNWGEPFPCDNLIIVDPPAHAKQHAARKITDGI